MGIADELLQVREQKGLKITFISRIVFVIMIILGYAFTAEGSREKIIMTGVFSCFLVFDIILTGCVSHKHILRHIGLLGVLHDVLFSTVLTVFWANFTVHDEINAAVMLKLSLFIVTMAFLILNSFAIRPLYPVLATAGFILLHFGVLAYILTFGENIRFDRIENAAMNSALSIDRFIIETGTLLVSGLFLAYIVHSFRKTVLQAVSLQEKLIRQEKKIILGDIATGMAHEIKNQLNMIGFLDLIKTKLTDNEQQYITYVHEGRNRILSMIDEVRAMAKNEETSYTLKSADVSEVIEEAIRLIKMDKEVKFQNITFSKNFFEDLYMDRDKILQVLLNLLRNSSQAITGKKNGFIKVFTQQENSRVIITIVDNGVGITDGNLSKIWEPFYSTKGEKGTGIGLDICKRIIEGHKGIISCDNQSGEGTTFRVSLPLTP